MTGAQLKAAREHLGLTQVEVAAALGTTARNVRRVESGEQPVWPWLTRQAGTMVSRLLDAMGEP